MTIVEMQPVVASFAEVIVSVFPDNVNVLVIAEPFGGVIVILLPLIA